MGMFKAVVRYFAGAPSPAVKQAEEWVPGEPVQSILRAYAASHARFVFTEEYRKSSTCPSSVRTLRDRVTGVSFSVITLPGMYCMDNELYGEPTGLNLQETIWLLQQVSKNRKARRERLEYLLNQRRRAKLNKLYVK